MSCRRCLLFALFLVGVSAVTGAAVEVTAANRVDSPHAVTGTPSPVLFADGFEPIGIPAPTNAVVLYSRGGTLSNRPVSIGRVFRQGEISSFAKASVPGITQCDVKGRWPDGSLKFAIISFIVPSLPVSGVSVSFSNQLSGNNTGFLDNTALTSTALLDQYDFDGRIQLAGGVNATASARDMLIQGRYRYWLQGPIVTAVVIEDRNPALPYDTGVGHMLHPLHPIFEAWFYPSNETVDLGYTLENTWASSTAALSMRDISYTLTLTQGIAAIPVTDPYDSYPLTHNHIARTRWHKRFWVGGNPGDITVDHGLAYLAFTRALPNFDVSFTPPAIPSSEWESRDKTLDGGAGGIGSFGWDIDAGGGSNWIGLIPRWAATALYGGDARLWDMTYKNADLAGYMVYHFRERDQSAGTGNAFDARDGAVSGVVDTFARVVSVNARKGMQFWGFNQCAQGENRIAVTGSLGAGNWNLRYGNWFDNSHMPDIGYVPYLTSGRHYYLEELQMEAAYTLGFVTFCSNTLDSAYYGNYSTRGDGWAFRTLAYAAFLSTDASAEKAYFEDKIGTNIAFWEGQRGVPLSDASRSIHWTAGQNQKIYVNQVIESPRMGPPALHLWAFSGGVPSAGDLPVRTDAGVQRITSPWMENFVIMGLGVARDFGYESDALLRFIAQNRFNQLLNVSTSPFLIEAYRQAAVTSANGWVAHWSDVNGLHHLPSSWVSAGYDLQARAALSFLYPYTCAATPTTGAQAFSGQQAWNAYSGNDWSPRGIAPANKVWVPPAAGTGSPLWALLPRQDLPSDVGAGHVSNSADAGDGNGRVQ